MPPRESIGEVATPPARRVSPRAQSAQAIEAPDASPTRSADVATTERSNRSAARVIARAIVFSALLFVGLGIVALIVVGNVDWVYPLTGYAVFVVWAYREFF